MKEKLFTKSAFKQALTCPASMHYYHDSDLYANQNNHDDFLQALAMCGNQAGELAKVYYGIKQDAENNISTLDYDKALSITSKLMDNEDINIAEAAFKWENCFVLADIIEKKGKTINLIEVKAKSWNEREDSFLNKKGTIPSAILQKIYDVAFQKYVIQNALGDEYKVNAFLMMADKNAPSSAEYVNQHFPIVNGKDGRIHIERDSTAESLVGETHILKAFPVDEVCQLIIDGETGEQKEIMGCRFREFVKEMSQRYVEQDWISSPIGAKCFKCQFYSNEKTPGMLDGKKECWKEVMHFTEEDFAKPSIGELWCGLLGPRRKPFKEELLEKGKYFLEQLEVEDIPVQEVKGPGLSNTQRRLLQIALSTGNEEMLEQFRKNIKGDTYLDVEGLTAVMKSWKPPYHMIDFETTSTALPLYKGQHPYDQVAFQFSHHVIEKDGTIRHQGQWLNTEKHFFPNFEFVRQLKKELGDEGSIFRYGDHENSILRAIHRQLAESSEPDKEELMAFIDSITHDKNDKNEKRYGERDMVDLLEIVRKYFYHPSMKGSNSIKAVLPAVLTASQYIRDKYSRPIYGSEIKSLNIKPEDAKSWISISPDGEIENPYKHLDGIASFLGVSTEKVESFDTEHNENEANGVINNGGVASAAYNKLQFSEGECTKALAEALLRYCELDTMSMVFLWEYFNHEIKKQ